MNRCLLYHVCSSSQRNVLKKTPLAAHLLPKRFTASDRFYLQSLGIKGQFRPAKKLESFVKRSFFGELDKDYLDFPNLVFSDQEDLLLRKQYDYIRRNFTKICSDQESLIKCGLFHVDSMTSFELVHQFEAIGASLNYQPSLDANFRSLAPSTSSKLVPIGDKLLVTDSFMTVYKQEKSFVQSILPLLVHNALMVRAITGSSNTVIKERLSTENGDHLTRPGIAFAFCELNDTLAALPYPYWDSFATYNPENDTWTVNGSKSRIIKSNYHKYIIFCKTLKPGSNGENTDDYGIASFLVDKAEVQIENDGTDNYGNEYLKISFNDLALSREQHELFIADSEPNFSGANFALNTKAHGQLATSAVILGMMKESVGNLMRAHQTGKFACNESLLQERTFQLSQMLYSLESMLYLTASHFDSFHTDHMDLFLQAQVVKTMASEFAIETMNTLRFLLDPHLLAPVVSTQTINVLNVLDAFLDSATSNRMLLATYGLQHIGTWKFDHIAKMRLSRIYFDHFFKYVTFPSFRKKVLHRSSSSMDDFKSMSKLKPSLQESANLLKKVLGEVMEEGDHILQNYGKDCVYNQIDMNRFASTVMSAFQMVSVISRANHSLHQNTTNSPHELTLCRTICRQEAKKVTSNTRLIYGVLDTSEEKRSKAIHKRNMRFDGYFAKPTFDRII